MASQADDYLLTAQETAKEISTNEDIIAKMRAGTNNAADIKKANEMISEIRKKFSELSKQIESVDKAYVKYKTKDYLTFKKLNQALKQIMNFDALIALAAVMLPMAVTSPQEKGE